MTETDQHDEHVPPCRSDRQTRLTAAAIFAICAANGEVWSQCRLGSANHCSSSEYCDGSDRSAAGEAPERPIWPLRQRTAVSALGAMRLDPVWELERGCDGHTKLRQFASEIA